MKHLILYNPHYRELLHDFTQYVAHIGYNKGSQIALPSHVQEFFHWLEQRGCTSLGGDPLAAITPELIREHYDYLNQRPNYVRGGTLSGRMIHHHLYALKTFMNHQEESGRIRHNPFSVLTFPRPAYPVRQILRIEEINALYEVAENRRDQALLALFYGCGLRRSEAIQLNSTDLHFKTQLLYVRSGKNQKRRAVPMSARVKTDLQDYYLYERPLSIRAVTQTDPHAFILNNQGRRMRQYWERLKYLVQQAALPQWISLHHLRHSIATHLLESGLRIEQVRDFLGHKHLESTQLYTKISNAYLADQIG